MSADRSRRRIRKEVRVTAFMLAIGVLGTLAVLAIRSPRIANQEEPDRFDPVPAPFSIELEPPIPETSEASDPDVQIDFLPVAFPGYLLPGEDDSDEEYGHARP